MCRTLPRQRGGGGTPLHRRHSRGSGSRQSEGRVSWHCHEPRSPGQVCTELGRVQVCLSPLRRFCGDGPGTAGLGTLPLLISGAAGPVHRHPHPSLGSPSPSHTTCMDPSPAGKTRKQRTQAGGKTRARPTEPTGRATATGTRREGRHEMDMQGGEAQPRPLSRLQEQAPGDQRPPLNPAVPWSLGQPMGHGAGSHTIFPHVPGAARQEGHRE